MQIKVTVHPNSKNPRVEKDLFGGINVYVKEPPLEGRANAAVILALADFFKVKNYQVQLLKGEKSKMKTFEIKGGADV